MSALAQPQTRPMTSDPSGCRPGDTVSRSSLNAPPPAVITTHPHPSVPLEIWAMIENIFSHSVDEERMLERIQSSPKLSEYFKNTEDVRVLAEAIAESEAFSRSSQVLVLAHILECHMKQNVYQGIVFRLGRRRLWGEVLRVVALGREHTGKTTSRLLGWRARALLETQDFAALETILQEYKEQGLQPSRRVYHLILSGHIQNRDVGMAKQCLLAMSEAGVPPDASTHAIIATYYRALGLDANVEARGLEALEILQDDTAANVLNSLIQQRLDCQDLRGAIQLLALFEQPCVGATYSVISSMLDAESSSVGGKDFPALNLSPTIRHDITPNAATFSIFMNYLTAQSHFPEALLVFQNLITAGITPTSFNVVSLIHLLSSAGQGDIAVRLVASICSDRTPFHMFKSMLSPTDRQDLPWVPRDVPPTIQIFNALFRGVLRTRGLDVTGAFLRIMQTHNIQPDAVTLEILLGYLGKNERANPRLLFDVLRRFTTQDLKPTLRHMHIIFSCALRHQKFLSYGRGWDKVAVKFSQARREDNRYSPKPPFVTSGAPFDPTAGIRISRHKRLARPSIKSLAERNALSDPVMVALRILHDAILKPDSDTGKDVFRVLVSRGMRPTEYHFSGLMEGFARWDNLEGAIDVMKSAEKVGIKPNCVMFTILISGHARRGDPAMALQTFQQMVSSGVHPDVGSIDAVASAFFAVGDYPMCKIILISLWPYIQPFPEKLRTAPLKRMISDFRRLAHNYRQIQQRTKQEVQALQLKLGELREGWCSAHGQQADASD